MVLIVLEAIPVSASLAILSIYCCFVSKECECNPFILLVVIFFDVISVRYNGAFI
jgi:hypothetical protein